MCPHEEKLTAWLLGDLSPEEHEALTRHLADCDSCRSVKEELARVLSPLRSGLEKDRQLSIEPLPARAEPPRRTWGWLWATPHEGLKRAAILTLSIGSLFALLSVVYQKSQRIPHSAESVTHITFVRSAEAPAPSLAPVAKLSTAAADKDSLVDSVPRSESFTPSPAAVMAPATPAPEPQAPAFRRLVNADADHDAKQKQAVAAAAATATAPAPALSSREKNVTKRERSKSASAATKRPDPGLLVRDFKLAAPPPAPTNTAPTNVPPASVVTNLPPPRK